jgi:hypothetical protein
MVRKIIGIAGRMHAGKDTAGDYLCAVHNFKRFAFADALKKGVKEMAGLTHDQCWGESKDTVDDFLGVPPRKLMRDVGMFMRDTYGDDFWARNLIRYSTLYPDRDIVITDVRFPNEAALIRNLGGYIVRIWKPSTMNEIVQHVSEHQDFHSDDLVHNDSSYGELYRQFDEILNKWYDTPIPESLPDGRHFMEDNLH